MHEYQDDNLQMPQTKSIQFMSFSVFFLREKPLNFKVLGGFAAKRRNFLRLFFKVLRFFKDFYGFLRLFFKVLRIFRVFFYDF